MGAAAFAVVLAGGGAPAVGVVSRCVCVMGASRGIAGLGEWSKDGPFAWRQQFAPLVRFRSLLATYHRLFPSLSVDPDAELAKYKVTTWRLLSSSWTLVPRRPLIRIPLVTKYWIEQ